MHVRRFGIGIATAAFAFAFATVALHSGPAGAQGGGNIDIEEILPGITDAVAGRCVNFVSDGDGLVPEVERDDAGRPIPNGNPTVVGPNPVTAVLAVDVPGEPLAAVLEWSGTNDQSPPAAGESSLDVTVTGPGGATGPTPVAGVRESADGSALIPFGALPQALDANDQPTGRPPAEIYTWIQDVTSLFGAAGSYQLDVTGYEGAQAPESGILASWGVTVTIIYDEGDAACEAAPDVSWKVGADIYFGGDRPAEEVQWGGGVPGNGHLSEIFVFELPFVPQEDLVIPVQFSSGGSDMSAYIDGFPNGPTFDQCRVTSVWYTAGGGAAPPLGSQFVSIKPGDFDPALGVEWGRPMAKADFGAVEILRGPFNLSPCSTYQENPPPQSGIRTFETDTFMGVTQEYGLRYEPGHRCPDGAGTGACANLAVVPGSVNPAGGGWRGPEWALVDFRVVVPAGSNWFAFQLESPTEERVKLGVSPESGGWSGQVLAIIPQQLDEGSLEVTKTISGETAGYDAGTTFTVAVDCDGTAFDQQFELTPGGAPGSIGGIPVGTTCTVSELATPPPVPGFSYAPPTFTPSNVVVVNAPQLFEVTIDNPIVNGQLGALEVVKLLDPVVQETFGSAPFGFLLDCSDDSFDQGFEVTASQPFTLTGIPLGTTCSITESARPPTGSEDVVWGPPVYEPGQNVVITEAGATVSISVRNPLDGRFLVTKTVSDPNNLSSVDLPFTLEVTCDNGFSTTLVLRAGETWLSPFLPVGTRCLIVETVAPEPGQAARWLDPPNYSPAAPGGEQAVVVVGAEAGGAGAAQVVEVQNVAISLQDIPQTGSDSDVMALLGGILVTTGTGLILVDRRPRRRGAGQT